jgi:hypothetical protein
MARPPLKVPMRSRRPGTPVRLGYGGERRMGLLAGGDGEAGCDQRVAGHEITHQRQRDNDLSATATTVRDAGRSRCA